MRVSKFPNSYIKKKKISPKETNIVTSMLRENRISVEKKGKCLVIPQVEHIINGKTEPGVLAKSSKTLMCDLHQSTKGYK